MSTAGTLDRHPVFAPEILRGFHLLESDAGTGKTWTIAGLVVRALVERELDIDRILVVTFTKAATAELAARIRERIGAMAALLEAGLSGEATDHGELFCREYLPRIVDRAAALRRLRIANARIDEAAVRTIHGFCQRVIDEHGLSIGMAGGVEVGEGDDGWIEALVDDWWRRELVGASEAELALIAECGIDPSRLAQRVRAIHANPAARRAGPGEDWRELAQQFSELRGQLAIVLATQAPMLLDWISVRGNVNGRMIRRDWASGWLARIGEWAARPAGLAMSAADRARFADLAGRLGHERFRQAVGERPMPPGDIPELCSRLVGLLARSDRVIAQLAEIAWRDAEPRRAARLVSGNRLAFDDLLAIVHEALEAPGSGRRLARQLRERYPLALIDECQDTDSRQWEIFRRIHLDPADEDGAGVAGACAGLVLVGDPKQAIYAFRGADVYSYLEARKAGPAAHALRENQRSVPGLIAAVNTLFGAGDAFGVPGIGFVAADVGRRPRRTLSGAPGDATGSRAPLTVLRFAGEAPGEALDVERAAARAVSITVAEIRRLLEAGLRLDDVPVAPSDIAVLVDSHLQGCLMKRALAAVGIGAVEISRERVPDSPQAEELSRWLAAAAEPADAGLLRAALLAAPTGLDAAALEALAAEPARWNAWVERFASCRETWAARGAQAALRGLLFESGAPARLAALRDGERRLTNLLHLFELIAASDEAAQGPRQAWRWLERMRAGEGQSGGEAFELRLDSDERLVRILTVHKSKGLEFPFVFLPFAWQGRAYKPDAPFVHHFGPGSRSGESEHWQAVLELSDWPAEGARAQRVFENQAESMRRLYVALTRAEQRCHVLWGPAGAIAATPLASRLAALAGFDPQSLGELDAQALVATADAWRLAAGPESVDICEVDAGGGAAQPQGPGSGKPDSLAGALRALPRARSFSGSIAAPWIRTSFSALAQRIAEGGAVSGEGDGLFAGRWGDPADERPDHDQAAFDADVGAGPSEAGEPTIGEAAHRESGSDRIRPPAVDLAAPPEGEDIRFAFPAGPRAGTCLHGILEHCDFDSPVDRGLVATGLSRAGFATEMSAGVAGWLDSVLDTGLRAPDGRIVSLRALTPGRVVREMDFLLPGEGVNDQALLDAVAREYPLDFRLAGTRWSGFLRGFIDLVFEQDGRWYLLDWKSNHLGRRLADYGPDGVEAAMREHAYGVQICLYLLVLHRLLGLRIPDYDWDRDVGGAFWVFLRGVRPEPSSEVSQHAGSSFDGSHRATPGVHASKPSRALIERLDRLFGAERR